jgi:hypothetical protein
VAFKSIAKKLRKDTEIGVDFYGKHVSIRLIFTGL